eukprot:TRINITY_DN10719_c0_g1_i1.p2 TRINITY_DN10719_c0_g1~~TRINITY_DN10719_c0_g1_i1.p2  ORF type:complete len:113 (+),score=25.58 TRINITY_DN10719_c0_g1_i1:74-412(+)
MDPQQTDSSATYARELFTLINHEDVVNILQSQEETEVRLLQSIQTLKQFNDFSALIHNNLYKDYEKHTKMMKEMAKDIDNIFRRIRTLRRKYHSVYPDICPAIRDEDDEAMM